MASFSLPAFAKLSPRIARAERELLQMTAYYDSHSKEVAAGEWGPVSAVASGIHNVYNGLEDILLSLAKDVDDYVPTGSSAHQDILDQMAAVIDGVRPVLLDPALYDALFELKSFRHVVRHKYGMDLKPERVIANFELLKTAFPRLVDAVARLERAMKDDDAT